MSRPVTGMDVSKDKAGVRLDGGDRRLSGDRDGFRAIARWFGRKGLVRPGLPSRSTARPEGRVFNANPIAPARPGTIAG